MPPFTKRLEYSRITVVATAYKCTDAALDCWETKWTDCVNIRHIYIGLYRSSFLCCFSCRKVRPLHTEHAAKNQNEILDLSDANLSC